MRKTSAMVLGKTIGKLTRIFKIGGGSAAPGYYALKIYPTLIEQLIKQIPKNVVITGTNGKTTTARMLSQIAHMAGLKVIRNKTGSNLERGIASALIANYTLYPKPQTLDLGIWEVDEAVFNALAPKIKPDIAVFLNVSRDQLDRYGEVNTIVKRWSETLKSLSPKTTVVLNSDDKLVSNLAKKAVRFKINLEDLKINGLQGSTLKIKTDGQSLVAKIPVPGIYNVYNFLAAFTIAKILGIKQSLILKSLSQYKPAFGRMEKFDWGYMLLIKNPAGATEVLKTISPLLKPDDRLLITLNDNLADGTDVSWIWDVSFEKLTLSAVEGLPIICSGTRAYDLAVRLKYAGLNTVVEPDLKTAFKQSLKGLKGTLYMLPTYTAMLSLQKMLAESGVKKHYWEEEN